MNTVKKLTLALALLLAGQICAMNDDDGPRVSFDDRFRRAEQEEIDTALALSMMEEEQAAVAVKYSAGFDSDEQALEEALKLS